MHGYTDRYVPIAIYSYRYVPIAIYSYVPIAIYSYVPIAIYSYVPIAIYSNRKVNMLADYSIHIFSICTYSYPLLSMYHLNQPIEEYLIWLAGGITLYSYMYSYVAIVMSSLNKHAVISFKIRT